MGIRIYPKGYMYFFEIFFSKLSIRDLLLRDSVMTEVVLSIEDTWSGTNEIYDRLTSGL